MRRIVDPRSIGASKRSFPPAHIRRGTGTGGLAAPTAGGPASPREPAGTRRWTQTQCEPAWTDGGEMDLKQLRAVVTVAECGSVTRAADLLHLVQPAVSRQIRSLESELGVELFERSRHGMRPTPAGAALVTRAQRALTE